jgi:hypothetical protein
LHVVPVATAVLAGLFLLEETGGGPTPLGRFTEVADGQEARLRDPK